MKELREVSRYSKYDLSTSTGVSRYFTMSRFSARAIIEVRLTEIREHKLKKNAFLLRRALR